MASTSSRSTARGDCAPGVPAKQIRTIDANRAVRIRETLRGFGMRETSGGPGRAAPNQPGDNPRIRSLRRRSISSVVSRRIDTTTSKVAAARMVGLIS